MLTWPYGGIVHDIRSAVKGKANFLAALGLLVYTEVVGRWILQARGIRNPRPEDCFYHFYERYMDKLVNAYNPVAAAGVMCRYTLSVGWDGTLYDCDFNQMLDLPVGFGAPAHIRDFNTALLDGRRITVGQHCYGCTAGSGSSCGGVTAEKVMA